LPPVTLAVRLPAAVPSVIVLPGPTFAKSFPFFTVGGGAPTRKLPCMVETCASHTYEDVPSTTVTFQVVSPRPGTSDAWFTPGPERWKSCRSDWSETWMVQSPGSSRLTGCPFIVSEIVNPGPTVPIRVPPAP